MSDDLRQLTDTLQIDSRAVDVLTFKMKDGTTIRSDRLAFINAEIDVIRDMRPVYTGRPGEEELRGYLPPLATGEVNLRFRLMADVGGNIITMTKPMKWWERVVWKVGYAVGYLLGWLP